MSVIIASILGFLTGGVATFLLLKLQTRKPSAPTTTPSPVSPALQSAPEMPPRASAVPVEPVPAAADSVPDSSPALPAPEAPATAPQPPAPEVAVPTEPVAEVVPDEVQTNAADVDPAPEPITRHYLDPDIELLSYRIVAWGNSGRAVYAPQLVSYAQHPNHQIRKAVAIALGKIAVTGSLRSDEARAVQALGKLSRDDFSSVREAAVAALGQVKSAQVIPFLQQALRDADPDVVRLSSAALVNYKYYSVRPAAKPATVKKR